LRRFIVTESEADLTSHAGLGLIGMTLDERTNAWSWSGAPAVSIARKAPQRFSSACWGVSSN
jgi:hypothetical protein